MRKVLFIFSVLFTVSSFTSVSVADTYSFEDINYAFLGLYKFKNDPSTMYEEIAGPIKIKGTGKNNKGSYSAISLVPGTGTALNTTNWDKTNYTYKKSSKSAAEFIGDSAKYNLITGLVNMLYSTSLSDSRYAMVLQVALWEVMVDGVDNFSERYEDGNFYMAGMGISHIGEHAMPKDYFDIFSIFDMRAMVKQAFVDALAGNYVRTINDFFVLEGIDGDATRLAFDFVPAATPIPGVAVLLGSGVAGMLAIRRRMVAA